MMLACWTLDPTTPTANNKVWVDSTMAALPATEAVKEKEANRKYPGVTLWGYWAGKKYDKAFLDTSSQLFVVVLVEVEPSECVVVH